MRTDSVSLSQEALNDIRAHITQNFDGEYLPPKPVFYANKSKNAQEAHEAIRPTAISRSPANLRGHLSAEQFRLYEMIWKRTLACQMTQAQFDTVSVDIAAGDEALFRASGQTLVFPGFIAVYREDEDEGAEKKADNDDESRLPILAEGETLPIDRLWGDQHFTQPPPRYSEASLVKALEEYGIGRPSTYANIISTLVNREYVLLDKKRFTPTDVGVVVNKFLTEHFARYVDYDFTAKLEDQLDLVSEGKLEWLPVLEQFWGDFSKQVQEKASVSRADVTQEALDEVCPKCGKQLSIRLGRRGKFVGCSGFPECDFTRNLDGAAAPTEPVVITQHPEANLPVLLMNGPYGPYLQLGEAGEEGKKPKRISIPKNLNPAQVTPEIALQLLSLPRQLGTHSETGKVVNVNIGRFGPYIQHDGGFRSIPRADNVFDISLERAQQILAEPKAVGRGALRQLGPHPDDQQPIGVYSGRYGAYVKHGKVNATLPTDTEIDALTIEEAIELLAARVAKTGGATKKKAAPKKKAATKKKVAAKKPAKKAAAKKPAKDALSDTPKEKKVVAKKPAKKAVAKKSAD